MAVIASYSTMRALFATSATPLDQDSMEPWPYATKMNTGGFTGGFTGIPTPLVSFPFDVSVDASAVGAEAYDIYLSQRSDQLTEQYFAITRTATKSGTWTIALRTVGVTALGLTLTTDPLDPDQASRALRYCALYVKRHSDGALQWVDLLNASLGDG